MHSPEYRDQPDESVVWTASATGCTSPQYRFFTHYGTAWSVAQEWSTSPTFSWNTTGLATGDYLIEVWARNGSSGSYQAISPDAAYSLY